MKIHVISTINGQLDEGMRNIASHISRCLERNHRVTGSGLKNIAGSLWGSAFCDAVLIFARANSRVYWLCRVLEGLQKNIWLVCVQKPHGVFITLTKRRPLRVNYLALTEKDLQALPPGKCGKKAYFLPGIDQQKFCPVDPAGQRALKEKYGFPPDRLLVLHVGHCSEGRGLADFLALENVEKVVVSSGLFENADVVSMLEAAGVSVVRGYQPRIEEFYQMADVYLFPTRSAEYVISIPLSVMEALACGVPVVGYRKFEGLSRIPAREAGLVFAQDCRDLQQAVYTAAKGKQDRSFLTNSRTWEQTAEAIEKIVGEKSQ